MKTWFGSQNIWTALTLAGCLVSTPVRGQNPPILSITGQSSPQISISGAPGASYEIQYATNLNLAVWHPLTNLTLNNGPSGFTDTSAASNYMRWYRALLLTQNLAYAPAALSPGELFQFEFVPAGFPNQSQRDQLAINSATHALWVRQTLNPGAMPVVTVTYQRLGNFSAQLQVVEPPGFTLPLPRTNTYTLYFITPNGGFYQLSDGFNSIQSGTFTRNTALVGQQLAASEVMAGQIFKFGDTNFDAATLVINSATSGVILRNPGASELITSVGLRYERLGPLTGQFEVRFSGESLPTTNYYWFIQQSPTAGIFNQTFNSSASTFTLSNHLVGAQLATSQLEAGELYRLAAQFSAPTDLPCLLVNTATNGLFINPPQSPSTAGIAPALLDGAVFGPLHFRLDVVFPPVEPNPFFQTNRYDFVYTGTNSGIYQLRGANPGSGTFVRDRSRVGQIFAPASLSPHEVFVLLATNQFAAKTTILVMDTTSTGSLSWFPPESSIETGIFAATVGYSRFGPLSARLELAFLPPGGNPQPVTNIYYLAYLAPNSGYSQALIPPQMSAGFGTFTADVSLIGQQPAQPELQAGEVYEFIFTGGIMPTASNVVTLVVESATNGWAFWQAPSLFSPESSGLAAVIIQHQQLSSIQSEWKLILPGTEFFPTPTTNVVTLVFSATNSGLVEIRNSSPSPASGLFRRRPATAGAGAPPVNLAAGQSYQIVASNVTSRVVDTLLLESASQGVLYSQTTDPTGGIFPNTTFYLEHSGNYLAILQAVIPAQPPFLESRTNQYRLLFTTTNGGLVQRSSTGSGNTPGQFQFYPAQ